MQNDLKESMTTVGDVNVNALKDAYDKTIGDLGWYLEGCYDSYKWRRNIWSGKSRDLRKHGSDAFPWDGASDTEAHVISQRINTYIALFMLALQRANIRAYPTSLNSVSQARTVSSFLKWMITSYIPAYKKQMELGGNNLLERGLMMTYVGWERENRTIKQRLNLEQLGQVAPKLAQMVMEGQDDDKLIALLMQTFGGMTEKKAKKVLNQLRKKGEAEFPIVKQTINRPYVESLAPDSDFIFPAYTTDPQQAPYCFRRVYMTAQKIRNKVATEDWDSDWAEYVIENCKGTNNTLIPSREYQVTTDYTTAAAEDLYEVIYAYQRLTDLEDQSQGIYCTVFVSAAVSNSAMPNGVPPYAKHELLNGYDDYPVVVTKLSEDDKRLYELITIPEQLRGVQWQVKVERDSRADRNSLATLPPVLHPVGRPPPDMGPNVKIPYLRKDEVSFGPTPPFNAGSVELENTLIIEADNIMGLNPESPLSANRQQYLITKFLEHNRDVIQMAFKCYQRFGPDEVFFRVTGSPDPQRFTKGNPDENFDIVINYDVLNNDPETVEKRLNAFASLVQFDKNGRIDMDLFLDSAGAMIDPIMADAFMRPAQEAQQQVVKQVTDDLTKIFSGIEAGARPNGAQVALQVIQQYAMQPDVNQRLQSDESFRNRLIKYQEQYQFQLQQAQNAVIGRIGTQPAQMGGMNTQGMS